MVELTRICPDCGMEAPCVITTNGRVQIRCKATRGHNGCGYIGTSNLYYSGQMIAAAEAAEAEALEKAKPDAKPEPEAETDDGVQPGQSEDRSELEPRADRRGRKRRGILI